MGACISLPPTSRTASLHYRDNDQVPDTSITYPDASTDHPDVSTESPDNSDEPERSYEPSSAYQEGEVVSDGSTDDSDEPAETSEACSTDQDDGMAAEYPDHSDEPDHTYESSVYEDNDLVPDGLTDGSYEGQEAALMMFYCGICLEDEIEDEIEHLKADCRLDCSHQFCRDSLTNFVSSRVEEGLLPIPCPSCLADDPNTRTYITLEASKNLDLPESVAQRWERLEVEAFGVLVACPSCGESGMIARDDYLAADEISCPFGDCVHTWCKNCEQPLTYGDEHTCDGDAELAQAMEENGWRVCPGGCGTRIENIEGCNHMTCPTAGCFAHFCYRDGELIIRSQDRTMVSEAVRHHYESCQQFD